MLIKSATFVASYTDVAKLPIDRPAFVFVGRSNVGKSSLINMLVNHKGLAKASSLPGKTKLMNFFLINESFYLVDLPGYGYAKTSKTTQVERVNKMETYLTQTDDVMQVFVLIDISLPPQKIDLLFTQLLADNNVPRTIIFTKVDKINQSDAQKTKRLREQHLDEQSLSVPGTIISSVKKGRGRDEILELMEHLLAVE